MSEEFDELQALSSAMRKSTPRPDAARRADNLALAQKNFETLQGSPTGVRPSHDRPVSGLMTGVRKMLHVLSPRGVLAASTALVGVGLVVLLPQLNAPMVPQLPTPQRSEARSDAVAPQVKDTLQTARRERAATETDAVQSAPRALAPASKQVQNEAEEMVGKTLIAPAPPQDGYLTQQPDTEAFPEAETNGLTITSEAPVSTFSIDVDTASYAIVRSSLMRGMLPPRGAVRIEEMVNYFPYDYAPPDAQSDAPFRPEVTVTPTPWNAGTKLVHIAIKGQVSDIDVRPPLNLVFLIDTSGSMNQPDKLPLLKQSLSLLLTRLGPQDRIAIVAYAGSAGQVLAPTPASDRTTILAALERLNAGGSTAGQAGLQQAYATARAMHSDESISRVILATDGDFNVGLSDPDALKDYIATQRDSGTYLSVLGFGRGNLDDATMQALAQNGNGTAAYIDTLSEAQKVLVDQASSALVPIADDVKIQVEFNPTTVAEYRLIGYETRALRREDFNNDAVDAGEIGSGHSVTAIYEVTPVGSAARLSDPLRYAPPEAADTGQELGYLKLRYKRPGARTSALIETSIPDAASPASDDVRFAMAIAGFGQLLQGAEYLQDWGYDDAIALANDARGSDAFGYRSESVRLMRLAQSLTAQQR